jgi:hypothetical protein
VGQISIGDLGQNYTGGNTLHAGGDRGEDRRGRTSRKSGAPTKGRGASRVADAQINSGVLSLAAYRARVADPGPGWGSSGPLGQHSGALCGGPALENPRLPSVGGFD